MTIALAAPLPPLLLRAAIASASATIALAAPLRPLLLFRARSARALLARAHARALRTARNGRGARVGGGLGAGVRIGVGIGVGAGAGAAAANASRRNGRRARQGRCFVRAAAVVVTAAVLVTARLRLVQRGGVVEVLASCVECDPGLILPLEEGGEGLFERAERAHRVRVRRPLPDDVARGFISEATAQHVVRGNPRRGEA